MKSSFLPKNKPRILLVIENSTNSTGGMELSFLRHIKLVEEYLECIAVTIILTSDDDNYMGKLECRISNGIRNYFITISDIFLHEKNDLLYSCITGFLTDIGNVEQADGIQVYGAYQLLPFSCGLAASNLNIPFIISFRGSDFNVRIYHSQFNHLLKAIDLSSVCTFVNSDSIRLFKQLFPAANSVLIYNYFEGSEFVHGNEDEMPVKNNITLGCSGNFRRIMGIHMLLEVYDVIATRHPDVSLQLIGSFRPSEADYFHDRILKLKNSHKVHVTGFIDHAKVLQFVNRCDILLYPSISDGCPNKVLESMHMKKAIIASNTGGISDLIEDGKEGILVHPYDTHEWIEMTSELIRDPGKRKSLGQNANLKVNQCFTRDKALNDWKTLYKSAGLCL